MSRSPDVKNLAKLLYIWLTCLLTGSELSRQLRRRLQAASNPLLGLIYCRHLRCSANGRTAAYHVGTRRRRRRLFLLSIETRAVRNNLCSERTVTIASFHCACQQFCEILAAHFCVRQLLRNVGVVAYAYRHSD